MSLTALVLGAAAAGAHAWWGLAARRVRADGPSFVRVRDGRRHDQRRAVAVLGGVVAVVLS